MLLNMSRYSMGAWATSSASRERTVAGEPARMP